MRGLSSAGLAALAAGCAGLMPISGGTWVALSGMVLGCANTSPEVASKTADNIAAKHTLFVFIRAPFNARAASQQAKHVALAHEINIGWTGLALYR
jgi:hypothetical protein